MLGGTMSNRCADEWLNERTLTEPAGTMDQLRRLLEKTGFDVVKPPIVGGRRFPGSVCAGLRAGLSRLAQPNDVVVAYGIKNDLQIPPDRS